MARDVLLERELEALLDRHGMANILGSLGQVCLAKHDHIVGTCGESQPAMLWRFMGEWLVRRSQNGAVRDLSMGH